MTRVFRTSAMSLVIAACMFAVSSFASAEEAPRPVDAVAAPVTKPLPTKQINPNVLVPYKNSIPAQVATSADGGPAGSAVIQGTIGLRRTPEMGEAVALLEKRIQDPKDAMFHQWLAPEDLGKEFPADPVGVAAITSWLQSYGLTVVSVDQPRLLLTFSGPATAVEKAFHTKIHNFTAVDGSSHYANMTNPKVAGNMYKLVADFKLDNFSSEMKNYAGAVVAPKAGSAVALKPITAELAAKSATGTETLQSMGFTITPGFQKPGISTPQTLTVTYAIKSGADAPTGKISIVGDEKLGNIGMADLQGCKSSDGAAYSCSYSWTPAADMPTGEHKITANYSGDGKYAPAFTSAAIHSNGSTATSTTVTSSIINTNSGVNETFTSITTWTGSGATPTGTVALTCIDPSTDPSGGACTALPTATNLTSCTVNATAQTETCTLTYDLDANDTEFGSYGMTVTYSGDTTYASSNGTVFVDDYEEPGLGSVSITASPLSTTPGSGANITYTVVYTATTYTNNPTNFNTGDPTYIELTGSPITGGQTININTGSNCTWNAPTLQLTCTITSVVPTSLAAGTYTVNAEFSGNLFDEAQQKSTTFQVTTATLNNTVGVGLTPSSVAYGSGTSVAVAVTNTWTGSTAPTGTITLADAQAYLPTQTINLSTCTLGTNTYTCNYTWTLASTVPVSPDAVTATYSGDSNFVPSSGSANLTITGIGSGTVALSSLTTSLTPTTQTYGTATNLTLGATLTGVNGDGFPTGTLGIALGSATAEEYILTSATLPSTHCVESGTRVITCTGVTATTPATLPVGAYREWDNYSGNATYAPATYLGTRTAFTVNAATPTLALTPSPVSSGYGSVTGIVITATSTGVAGGTTPGGVVTFTKLATALGTLSSTTCTLVSGSCTVTYTPSATQAVGTITGAFTASEAANGNYGISNTASDNLTTTTGTATLGTVSFSPASSEPVGTNQAITISDTLTFGGAKPTGAVTFVLNGVTYTATCGSTSPATCSATVPGATIAALAVNTYTVTASLAALGNYGAASGTSSVFTITQPSPNLTFTSVSHNFGQVAVGTAATSYGISVKNLNTVAYPFSLVFTPANGFTSANNCGSSLAAGATCELVFYFTPTAAGPVSATWSLTPESGFYYGPSNGGTLQGSGTSSGGVSLTTNGHNFGTVSVGTQSPTYGTELSNSTTSAETISIGAVSAPFTKVTNCGTTLAAGASCEIEFYFTPTSTSPVSVVVPVSGSPTAITSGGVALPGGGITLSGN